MAENCVSGTFRIENIFNYTHTERHTWRDTHRDTHGETHTKTQRHTLKI